MQSAAHRDTLRVGWALTSDAPFTWPLPSYGQALRPSLISFVWMKQGLFVSMLRMSSSPAGP